MKSYWTIRILTALLVGTICLSLAVTTVANAQTAFHVSPSGNDNNPGTEKKPFQTIRRARDAVRKINRKRTGRIEVILHDGTYQLDDTLAFDHRDSGADGHNVVYKAAKGAAPVVSGGRAITGWKPDADGRWKAATNIEDFRQLYVNGRRAVRARGDVPANMALHGDVGYMTTDVAMADWKNPGDLEFCFFVVWCHTRCKVKSIRRDGDHAIVTMLQPHFKIARTKQGVQVNLPNRLSPSVHRLLRKKPLADYIENAFELLDEPGEWYLDRSADTLYYIPRPGEDMTTARVIAPNVETLVELRGTLNKPVKNIRFDGITFAHANGLRPSRIGLVDVQANFIHDPERLIPCIDPWVVTPQCENIKSPANVVCHAAHAVRFERCTFTKLGGAGLDLEYGSQDNVISGCHFHDVSGTAIQVGDVLKDDHHPDDPRMIVKNNSVVNNHIHDCCVDYKGGVGIFVGYTDRTTLAYNEIHDLPYSGISVGWGWGMLDAGGGAERYHVPLKYATPTPAANNRVENNHIHRVSKYLQDGGAIYTLGNMPGTIIQGNYFHDNPGIPGGVYLDEGSGFIEITGNVAHDVYRGAHYNNRKQNRIATCNEHDNFFDVRPGDDSPEKAAIQKIVDQAGPTAEYRDILKK
ncbi:MAG: right-handed parallel beta-helix repeat-containing protein [Pirellulales bacterium]|nr:right-handed parallel beta-helix repeat-containing protein [Pirellulales bacterium]